MVPDAGGLPAGLDPAELRKRANGSGNVIALVDGERRPVGFHSPASARRVPIAEPQLGGNELKYVTECIETNWISSQGSFVKRFEEEFARRLGVPHALAVSNGTVALHLALAAYGIGPGDEVIVPDLTFAATLNAVIYTGATPIIVDVARDTWNMDPEAVAAAITPRTKAIMPVHLYGQPADMAPILAIARRRGLMVVEDAAEAVGAAWQGTPCGAIGDCGTFSFFSNKLVTTGEGGMVVFKDDAIAARARRLRDHGMNPQKRYWHDEVGFNYRLTNLQAAIGCAQLEQLDGFLARKRQISTFYEKRLSKIAEIETPHILPDFANSYWVFSIIADCAALGLSRDQLMARLGAAGVDTRPLFYCMHEMPPYKTYAGNRDFPISAHLSANGLSLPSSTSITEAELEYVAGTIERIVGARRLARSNGT
ncbi:MAG: aminotransferase class I/II-fold pyridoxal phosphate-dependent enzyme [Alphaproteobacteria bacterium]|nr:aminotransferase class I/II-fold pyridoxal phosphate-dependent enzyme [Alphaproteobacteria bacterium]